MTGYLSRSVFFNHQNTHWIDHSHNTSLVNSLQCSKLWSWSDERLKIIANNWNSSVEIVNPPAKLAFFLLASIAICHLIIWWGNCSCPSVVVNCSMILATCSQSLDTLTVTHSTNGTPTCGNHAHTVHDNLKHTFHNSVFFDVQSARNMITLGYRPNNVLIVQPQSSLPRGCANTGDVRGQSCNWGMLRCCPSASHQLARAHDRKNTWDVHLDTKKMKLVFVTLSTIRELNDLSPALQKRMGGRDTRRSIVCHSVYSPVSSCASFAWEILVLHNPSP